MINITDLFGRDGLTGVVAYVAVAYLASGPLAERHAAKHLVSQCQSGHIATARAPKLKSVDEQTRDVAAELLEQQGGAWGGLVAKGLRFKSQMEQRQAEANAAAGAATCDCRIRHALRKSDVRWSWTVYVATWKLADNAPSATLAAAAVIDAGAVCKGAVS